jgi:hypothetical protein
VAKSDSPHKTTATAASEGLKRLETPVMSLRTPNIFMKKIKKSISGEKHYF